MDLEIVRYDLDSVRTIGKLGSGGVFLAYTLEDAVREGPKVPGATAIPAGEYEVEVTHSPKFKERLPLLKDVPGFTGIRIHTGNTISDTEGCIIVGLRRGSDIVIESRAALMKLLNLLDSQGGPHRVLISNHPVT